MPSKTVVINCLPPTYFSVASFLAVLAYPEDDEAERNFRNQLCLALLRHLAAAEEKPVLIEVPLSIFQSKLEPLILKSGLKRLWERFWVGYHIIMPDAGLKEPEGFTVNLEDMLKNTMADLGSKNLSTAKTKIWKPTWPVFHGAGSFAYHVLRKIHASDEAGSSVDFQGLIFALMAENEIEKEIVSLAEKIRGTILGQKIYKKIHEDNTVEFKLVNSFAEKSGFANAASSYLKDTDVPL